MVSELLHSHDRSEKYTDYEYHSMSDGLDFDLFIKKVKKIVQNSRSTASTYKQVGS